MGVTICHSAENSHRFCCVDAGHGTVLYGTVKMSVPRIWIRQPILSKTKEHAAICGVPFGNGIFDYSTESRLRIGNSTLCRPSISVNSTSFPTVAAGDETVP